MPRTRGQEVALQERGLPTTPPQQLPTPRRSQKPKAGNRKTKQPVAVSSTTSPQPSQTISHVTRIRSTSASQIDAQELKPVRTGVQKRGRQAKPKPKKVTQNADEGFTGGEAPESKVLQELSENSNGQAVQQPPRKNPEVSSVNPVSLSLSVGVETPLSSSGVTQRNKKIKPVSNGEAEESAISSSQDGATNLEPVQFETGSNLPLSEHTQEHKLQEIIHNSIPKFIALLQKHPDIEGNATLERLLIERDLAVIMKPLGKKKAPLAPRVEEQTLLVIDDVPESPRQTQQSTSRLLLKRKVDEGGQPDSGNVASKRLRTNSSQTKRVPQLFDDDGMLSLTAYKEVPIKDESSSEEDNTDSSGQPLREPPSQSGRRPGRSPLTPQPRGWALAGFLPSAQTVSRFLPTFSRRTPIVTPVPVTLSSNTTEISATSNSLNAHNNESASPSEPRPATSEEKKDEEHNEIRRKSRRHRHPKTKRALKAKNEQDEMCQKDELIATLRAQLDAQIKGRAQQEEQEEGQAKTATVVEKAISADNPTQSGKTFSAQSEVTAQNQVGSQITANNVTVQTPKSILKRKTVSPNVIPNPPSGGFSVFLDYSGHDSDSDSDTDQHESPSGPPNKKARTSSGTTPLYIGDRFRATPYLGKELALPPLPSETFSSHNTFLDTNLSAVVPNDSPPNGPTVTIRVPSPSDSDSEWDGTSYVDASDESLVTPSALTSALTRVDEHASSSGVGVTEKQHATNTKSSQGPSPLDNPNVNPAFDFSGSLSRPRTASELAFPTTWTYPAPSLPQAPSSIRSPNLALDKARQSALKHKPQQPSRLRETARLSTSTTGTEIDDDKATDKNKEIGDNKSKAKTKETASKGTGRDQNDQVNDEAHGLSLSKRNVFDDAQRLQDPEARDPYAGQVMRQSPHDPMLLEPAPLPHEPVPSIEQSPELAGEISTETGSSDEDMSENLPVFDGYAKVESLLGPQVGSDLYRDWDKDEKSTEIKEPQASKLQDEARAKFDEHIEEYFESQKEQFEKLLSQNARISELETIPKIIRDKMDNGWKTVDKETAVEKFGIEFEEYLDQQV